MSRAPAGLSWQEYAFRRLTDANPFPAVMGRVCPAPCEDGCNRNELDDHVGINSVEQYIGDTALAQGFAFVKPAQDNGKQVAIVGGGPAGLAAAYQLRRKGYRCTVFEFRDALGGMMRYGIPGYRTPREVLDGEIQRILDMGVTAVLNTRIGRDLPLEQLETRFDAVLWAIGAQSGKPLPIPGADAPNCMTGVAFLEAFNGGRLQGVASQVVVVGGDDTSIDVASIARRLGHISHIPEKDRPGSHHFGSTAHDVAAVAARQGATVTLTSLFPLEQMQAAKREIEDAMQEGVKLITGVMPLQVSVDERGKARALRMAECDMVDGRPVMRPGTEFDLPCELLVSAIGQTGSVEGIELFDNGRGLIDTDHHYRTRARSGHFAAGDILRPHLLTTAIGQGWLAAESMDQCLRGHDPARRPKVDAHHFRLLDKLEETGLAPEVYHHQPTHGTFNARFAVHNFEDRSEHEVIPSTELFLAHFEETPRHKRPSIALTAEQVLGNFRERIIGLDEPAAVSEANRCMNCGMCIECDNCLIYCPQSAVKRTPRAEATMGRYVYTDHTRCIGCHICADVCPTGYIDMAMGE
ncbi:MAG: NAD(P)-binding protein [Gammaproteobacteria bacterium]